MRLVDFYSHLNGEEFMLVRHKRIYQEIKRMISNVDAHKFRTKMSKEKGRREGKLLWNPKALNEEFKKNFYKAGWQERRRSFYVATDPKTVQMLEPLDFKEQAKFLDSKHLPKQYSFNQTDFVKDKVAVEVQMGKYFAVTYDLFVKHLSFYSGGIIDIGIEIVPMKSMQKDMSSGPPWFEKEVHNVLRHGRSNPPVPLLILGVAP